MKRWGHIVACGMFLFLRPMAHRDNRPPLSAQKSGQKLLELEDHWLQVEDDPDALEAILAPDFIACCTCGNYNQRPKANSSASCANIPRPGGNLTGTSKVCTFECMGLWAS